MEFEFLGYDQIQWLNIGISVVLVVIVLLLGRWLFKFVFNRIIRKAISNSKTLLDDVLLDATQKPLYWFWIVVLIQFAWNRLIFLPEDWFSFSDELFFICFVIIAFRLVWQLMHGLFIWYGSELAKRTEDNLVEQLLPFFRRVAMIIVGFIGLIILLEHFDVDVSAFVTTLGIGSLAIALAAQAALTDTISGFAIMIDRPFRIGDRIEIQELATWGDVVDIGLRSSRIRTRDNRMVVVPNSVISQSLIVNYSFPDTKYRIQINIGIGYGSDIELARKTIVDTVSNVEGVLKNEKVEALFLEFGPSSLNFRVRWWLDSYEDTRRMFDRVNTALYKSLTEVGIDIPFPQMEITLHNKQNE